MRSGGCDKIRENLVSESPLYQGQFRNIPDMDTYTMQSKV